MLSQVIASPWSAVRVRAQGRGEPAAAPRCAVGGDAPGSGNVRPFNPREPTATPTRSGPEMPHRAAPNRGGDAVESRPPCEIPSTIE